MKNIIQPTTEVDDPDMFKETVYTGCKCPKCKQNTLDQSEHLGIVSEKCRRGHTDTYVT